MITKYQADLENNHIRGITNYTPPTYTYIGLSTVAIDDSGTLPENAEPDASTGYARIRVRNNSETWNDSANGVISNKIRIEFPNEFTANAGIARYIFEPERGTVLDSNLNREYIGELGAGYHYCQANQKESYNNPPNDFRKAAPDWISADGVPALKFDGMYDNLTFYPTAFPLGAFTVDFEIKPDDGYDMLLMRHDNGNQVTGLSVFIVNGKLAIGYVRKTGVYSYMPTEFPVSPGKWSNVRITYDLQEFRVIVNGQEMRQEGSGRGMSTESLIFGSTSSRSFLPNPQIKNFKGELRSLRIYQNATN